MDDNKRIFKMSRKKLVEQDYDHSTKLVVGHQGSDINCRVTSCQTKRYVVEETVEAG